MITHERCYITLCYLLVFVSLVLILQSHFVVIDPHLRFAFFMSDYFNQSFDDPAHFDDPVQFDAPAHSFVKSWIRGHHRAWARIKDLMWRMVHGGAARELVIVIDTGAMNLVVTPYWRVPVHVSVMMTQEVVNIIEDRRHDEHALFFIVPDANGVDTMLLYIVKYEI